MATTFIFAALAALTPTLLNKIKIKNISLNVTKI
jgi:hypothetical protein